MAADKTIRCDCGYRVRGSTELCQVTDVRRHAWQAHGISFSTEDALAILLRRELEVSERQWTDRATAEDTTHRREQA
jgi:predicted small metal-binding protein